MLVDFVVTSNRSFFYDLLIIFVEAKIADHNIH